MDNWGGLEYLVLATVGSDLWNIRFCLLTND